MKPPLQILPASEWQPAIEGIFRDLPAKVYHDAPGVNATSMKECCASMLHYHHAVTKATEDEDEKAKHFIIGTITHLAKLEPHKLAGSYVVRPAEFEAWNSPGCKAWKAKQTLPAITPEEESDIQGSVSALNSDQLVSAFLSQGEIELSAFKIHPRTGLLLKARADAIRNCNEGLRWIGDIKTIGKKGTAQGEFSKQIAKRDYHMTDAHYRYVFDADKFLFIVVEKVAPYDVAIDELEAEDIEIGRRLNEAYLARIADCRQANKGAGVWPGNGGRVRLNRLPQWKRNLDGADLE